MSNGGMSQPSQTREQPAELQEVVGADDAGIGCRPLAEIDLFAAHDDLVRVMVAEGRQIGDEVFFPAVETDARKRPAMGRQEAAFMPAQADKGPVKPFCDRFRRVPHDA